MILKQTNQLVKNPLVSVIVPYFNRPDTIGQTIDSIMSQRCDFDFEVIIGDDCSHESAKDILFKIQNKYPQNIILLIQEENIGLGGNWAICVQNTRGKYIANCDDDDFWHNVDKLQLQINWMEANPDYGICHTDYRLLNTDYNSMSEIQKGSFSYDDPSLLQKAILSGRFNGCIATVVYRKSVLELYISLDDYIKYRFGFQDWNTYIILAAHTKFHWLPVSTTTYRRGHESITNLLSYDKLTKKLDADHFIFRYVCEMFPENLPYNEHDYFLHKNWSLLNLAIKKNDFPTAKKYSKILSNAGNKSLKVRLSNFRISFWAFNFLRTNLKKTVYKLI